MNQSIAAGQSRDSERHRSAPRHRALKALLGLAAVAAPFLSLAGFARSAPAPARIARTQNVADSARLHYVSSPGSQLFEEGAATGGLPGKVKVWLNIGATVTGSFTIYASGWSISGHGTGMLHGTGTFASFGGTMTISHGAGRFAHAHGHGGFYGTINRRTYAATVQTTGNLNY